MVSSYRNGWCGLVLVAIAACAPPPSDSSRAGLGRVLQGLEEPEERPREPGPDASPAEPERDDVEGLIGVGIPPEPAEAQGDGEAVQLGGVASIVGIARAATCVVVGRVIADRETSKWETIDGVKYHRPRRAATVAANACLKCDDPCPREPSIEVLYPSHAHSLRIQLGEEHLFFLEPAGPGQASARHDSNHGSIPIKDGQLIGFAITPADLVRNAAEGR